MLLIMCKGLLATHGRPLSSLHARAPPGHHSPLPRRLPHHHGRPTLPGRVIGQAPWTSHRGRRPPLRGPDRPLRQAESTAAMDACGRPSDALAARGREINSGAAPGSCTALLAGSEAAQSRPEPVFYQNNRFFALNQNAYDFGCEPQKSAPDSSAAT